MRIVSDSNRRSFDAGGEDLAKLVPFPSVPPAADPEPDDNVTELVPVDEDLDPAQGRYEGGVLVAGGDLPDEVVYEGELIEASEGLDRRFAPRPILPTWVLDRTQR